MKLFDNFTDIKTEAFKAEWVQQLLAHIKKDSLQEPICDLPHSASSDIFGPFYIFFKQIKLKRINSLKTSIHLTTTVEH